MGQVNTLHLLERERDRNTTKHYEGLFTQGSGYLHIRGSYEEGLLAENQNAEYMRLPANVTVEKHRNSRSKFGTYVPGITGIHPLLKEEIVNLPNPLKFEIIADGECLDMDESEIEDYIRILDMEHGILKRTFQWKTKSGATIQCDYERYVSHVRKNLIVQQISYTMLEGGSSITLLSDIDEKVKTNGYNHFANIDKKAYQNQIDVRVETDSKDIVYLSSITSSLQANFRADGESSICNTAMLKGDTISIDKLTTIGTSRDIVNRNIGFTALHEQLKSAFADRESLLEENNRHWEDEWAKCRIEIAGDDRAQLAVNFSIYHLIRCGNQKDDRVAICAKGFSGEAYFGHFFWDTEIYLLPFYLYTMPEVARNLTTFRLNTLAGAIKNAKACGYQGAKYPWESSVTGEEQCPNWQYADHEIHITADVVHALWHYYKVTEQKEYLFKMLPIFIETAKYWISRVKQKPDGTVHLNGVMGPDEYICFCNNNTYTNFMVKNSLQITLDVLAIVKESNVELFESYHITNEFIESIKFVNNALIINKQANGVLLQCDHFDEYEEPDFENVWQDKSKKFGEVISQEKNYRTKALKQADVLMLPYLFPDRFTAEDIKINYDYYLPYTTHDSSLSYIIHSIINSHLEDSDAAYHYFMKAMNIDLDERKGEAAEGIHIANCGGIWQAIIFGFAGMQFGYESDAMLFHPNLPKHWKLLRFRIAFHGIQYTVSIQENQVRIEEEGRYEGE